MNRAMKFLREEDSGGTLDYGWLLAAAMAALGAHFSIGFRAACKALAGGNGLPRR